MPPPQPRILGRRHRSASPLSWRSGGPRQRLRATFAEDNQSRTALTQREGAPGVGVNRPRSTPTRFRNVPPLPHIIGVRRGRETSDDRPSPRPSSRPRHRPPSLTLSQLVASARAWSNRAEGGATGSRLAAGSQEGKRLCGSSSLPSTAQCAGRGTTQPRSPSSIEEERRCAPISPNGARSRHAVRLTGSVGWDRGRSPTPFRATRSRGGETVPTDNGRASGGLSHPPARSQHGGRALTAGGGAQNRVGSSRPLPPGAALGFRDLNPMSQDARLAAGSFVRRGALGGTTPARSQHGRRTAHQRWSSY